MNQLFNVKRSLSTLGFLAVASWLMMSLVVHSVGASALVVNSDADTVAEDGVCTLREAIINANADDQSGSTDCAAGSGADAIIFAADYTITLGSQLPAVATGMTITGNGAANTIIEASTCDPTKSDACTPATWRVMQVGATGNLALNGMTVRHGNCHGDCVTSTSSGGGILNEGTLVMTNSTVSGNSAFGGGGILNEGTLVMTNSTLSGNSAFGGGGIDNPGMATLNRSTVSGNLAGDGGGIFNKGMMTVIGSVVSDHFVNGEGGGIYNDVLGTLSVSNSTLEGNNAGLSAGGGIFNNGMMTVTDSILSGNAARLGGAISNGSDGTGIVHSTTLEGNSSAPAHGGGISNSGTLTVTNSTLSGNSAFGSSFGGYGGGIYNSNSGTLTVTNSTLSGNSAGTGGGIYNLFGTLTVTNSTLSGNSAGTGGGIANLGGDTILRNSVVSGNSVTVVGSEIAQNEDAKMTAENNILGNDTLAEVFAFDGFDPDASNLVATSDKENIPLSSILETTLSDNGGPTLTLALVPGSPAIDFVESAVCTAPPVNGVDQRGKPRNVDGNDTPSAKECDAGAFEFYRASEYMPLIIR